MHELSIAQAIVDTALRHAAGRKVTVVDVRIGRLRQVVPDSLAFYFEIVARDTDVEGADLRIEHVGSQLRCPGVLVRVGSGAPAARHPRDARAADGRRRSRPSAARPAARRGEVLTGGELEVESIEVSDAAPATGSA